MRVDKEHPRHLGSAFLIEDKVLRFRRYIDQRSTF